MRILLYSPAFHPSVGGLEGFVAMSALGFQERGHQVVVVTTTPSAGPEPFPFRVVRSPGPAKLLQLVRWSEVFYQANVSLKGLWPLLLVRRPWVVSHHSWYRRTDGRTAWQDRLKHFLLRFAAATIAVSQAMAARLPAPTTVIPNAYRDELFHPLAGIERQDDLIFVGRLVSDKGVDLLLEALARLGRRGLEPRLTLVGQGPERAALEAQASRLGLASRVIFRGSLVEEQLVAELHRHLLLVVPSRYEEPFGMVALEGIACGLVVVGTAGGGLPEAIGPCGVTVPNGEVDALAEALAALLSSSERVAELRAAAPQHLARHSQAGMVEAYLAAIRKACGTLPGGDSR